VPDANSSRSGDELVPLRRKIDGAITLESPRLELLTPAQEDEAAELLAAFLAAAAHRRAEEPSMSEAA
jgi:hypothetical protein